MVFLNKGSAVRVVKIAQTAFSNQRSLQARGLINGGDMARIIRRQNVERYWCLLDSVTNEPDRENTPAACRRAAKTKRCWRCVHRRQLIEATTAVRH